MLWPLSVVLVANTNGRLAIPALAGLLVLPYRTFPSSLPLPLTTAFIGRSVLIEIWSGDASATGCRL